MEKEEKVPDLYRLAFMPGQFRCPKCDFQLSKQTMFMQSGAVGISESDLESEPCPNDGTPMKHVTYKEQLESYAKRLHEELERNDARPPEMSLQEAGRRINANSISIEAVLQWMKQHGQSVLLNWGEDDNLWECSWISGGERFTGVQESIRLAALQSINKAFTHWKCLSCGATQPTEGK